MPKGENIEVWFNEIDTSYNHSFRFSVQLYHHVPYKEEKEEKLVHSFYLF